MSGFTTVIVYLFGIFLYFIPSFLAHSRNSPNKGYVYAINFFLGWSFIGWVIALVMAIRN